MKPTAKQLDLLRTAIKDGTVISGGIDETPGLSTRVLNICIDRKWLEYTTGPQHPYIASFWRITKAGRKVVDDAR